MIVATGILGRGFSGTPGEYGFGGNREEGNPDGRGTGF